MSITTELQRISQAKTDLKTAIESKGVTIEDTNTLNTYASKVDEVYNKGYEKGKSEGGSDSFYDAFWDNFQPNNGVCSYDYAFYGTSTSSSNNVSRWTKDNFKPKYDIVPTSAEYIFYHTLYGSTGFDLVEHLESIGKRLDFSQCKSFSWAFYDCVFTRVGVIDMSAVTKNQNNVFRQGGSTRLETIDKLIVPNGFEIGGNSFTNCNKLKNLTIEGTITGNFSLSSSPLTVESMKSVITHLANYAGTDEEFTYKVYFKSDRWDAIDAEGNTAPHGGTWKDYVGTLGWNV